MRCRVPQSCGNALPCDLLLKSLGAEPSGDERVANILCLIY
jgi:hypothetical protein